ncbi:MAG TPA: glycerate kinase, partial [Acidobacteriota bacterium]|nr:glycerate kinase [Acidobacteriota bacterium]
GKASAPMARALEEILGARVTGGTVVVKYGHSILLDKVKIVEASHPIPDQAGLDGARQIIKLVEDAGKEDLILCVISGGGSALLPMPVGSVTLKEKQQTTQILLDCGATIQEVNAVRKHLSNLKGGRLAKLAQPATLISLILSDVVGDRLDAIASGPTAPDTTTFADCLEVVARYNLRDKIPQTVIRYLERGVAGAYDETPKPWDTIFHNVQNVIVGNNRSAIAAAAESAEALGYHVTVVSSPVTGESRTVAQTQIKHFQDILRGRKSGHPLCLVSGGETNVTVRGDGLGGRNQEFALAAAIELAGSDHIVVLSAGTDGTDGPTDAAGAIVDGQTIQRGNAHGLNARDFLARNDSYHFLQVTGDLLKSGPTLTNVMDLQILLYS